MKQSIGTIMISATLITVNLTAQTLQEVTDNGNTTDKIIYVNSLHVNDGNSKMFLGRENEMLLGSNTYVFGYKNFINNSSNSIVTGYYNQLSGFSSSAVLYGRYNNAGGHHPMVFGYRNNVHGATDKSYTFGRDNYLEGISTYAFGVQNVSTGKHSGSLGYLNEVQGQYSTTVGFKNYIGNHRSFSFGAYNSISSHGSAIIGYGNNVTASASYSYIIGYGLTNNISSSVMIGTNNASKMTVLNNGNVLIGKVIQQNPVYKLDVGGIVRANKVVVNTTGADFVFEPMYKLPSLKYVEEFIIKNKHLPDIPSAIEMQQNGLDVGEQQTKLLQKIEELTLYLIEQSKELEQIKKELEQIKKRKNKK